MAMNVGGDGNYASEINVTPLVDVVLVLLIIFMMIVPIMLKGYDVDVPGEKAMAPPDEKRVEQIVLTIDLKACPMTEPVEGGGLPTDCTVRLNREAVPVATLATRLEETYADRMGDDRVLFLAAHDHLNYEGVMRILDFAKSNVADLKIGLVTVK